MSVGMTLFKYVIQKICILCVYNIFRPKRTPFLGIMIREIEIERTSNLEHPTRGRFDYRLSRLSRLQPLA
jgi:hypothetical protein